GRDELAHVLGALTRAKLDDSKVGEIALDERVLHDDRLYLLLVISDRKDDAAHARDLAARNQEVAGGVVLVQERHVRAHVRIDLSKVRLVDELDDEHLVVPSAFTVTYEWRVP